MTQLLFKLISVTFVLTTLITIIASEQCLLNENCHLPNCNCDSYNIPVNFSREFKIDELPQIVVLTIDDEALDIKSYQVYRRLLKQFKNPNGCPIKATFFLSDTDNKTSYCLVRNLYERNHEIAISTVNYTCPQKACQTDPKFRSWTYQTWLSQILGMRQRLRKFSAIPYNEVVGFRSPLTEPASDMHYRIIAAHQFLYDSSLITNSEKIYWPFTLDYSLDVAIMNNGPIKVYPGLWELPIPINLNKKQKLCGKLWEDPCDYKKEELGDFFRKHFLRAYYTNRAPLVVHLNSRWLKSSIITKKIKLITRAGRSNTIEKVNATIEKKEYLNLKGLMTFINKTTNSNKNVYFLSAQQAIQWMRLLPRLRNSEWFNITELINKEILDDCSNHRKKKVEGNHAENEEEKYNGKCEFLKQKEPDYDDEETIYLDDDEEIDRMLVDERYKSKLVLNWQSENLFVNDVVLIFVGFLAVLCIILILYDRYGNKTQKKD